MLEVGMKKTLTKEVKLEDTAAAFGNGGLAVLGTPQLLALMEEACKTCAEAELAEGQSTVGTAFAFKHMAPTPVGMTVRVEAEITEIDRRRLVFSVKAFDDEEQVIEGTHERFVVPSEAFVKKANEKAAKVAK